VTLARRRTALRISIAALLAMMGGLVAWKVIVLGYSFDNLIPRPSYAVDLSMTFTGYGDDVTVRTFLPASGDTQLVSNEAIVAPGLASTRDQAERFVAGEWSGRKLTGPYEIDLSFDAQIRPARYRIDPALVIPDRYPEALAPDLLATDVIQLADPLILELSRKTLDPGRGIEQTLRNIYAYVSGLGERPFKGTTDAVTAARLGEASCNGKSRLFVALARNAGIPARLVGGLILEPGTKRTSHQWVEAYVAGHWVPFDALNRHWAVLPDNYLALYRGDEVLFVHTPNIGFDYRFSISRRIVTNEQLVRFLGGHAFNLYRVLSSFRRVNISLPVLQFLLMIPFGVLVVVVARNVFGLGTFGTFLPALMAVAVRETGIVAGIVGFLVILGVAAAARIPLKRLGVLHTPKLAILMIIAILTMLGLTVFADLVRIDALSSVGAVSLFPIAILTLTAERISLSLEEDGWRKTALTMTWTLLVMAASYYLMNAVAVQALILAFPELYLGVIALNLWIGNWTGLRVSEMLRFRSLYAADPPADPPVASPPAGGQAT
jgi:hypothetical protein